LTKGKSLWEEFEKKMIMELDSIEHLDAAHQATLIGLSKTDSLHNAVNRLPGLQKKRDAFWKARKAKKDIFVAYETTYSTAKAAYDEGDMLPSEWDTIEEMYLAMKEELDFLKAELQKMNAQITTYREDVARLKKETGLLQYKSYREF
jgi:chromosome segregation ATPase